MRHRGGFGRSRRIGVCIGVAVLVSLLAGCVQAYPISRAPEGDPVQAARQLPDAPDAVKNGDAARTCGAFVLDQGEGLPAEAVSCLSTALAAREEAELAWTVPTVEGDPIVHFAFVGETTDEVTVVVTNAFDSYGGDPSWTSNSCADVAAATSYVGCVGADLDAAADFGSIGETYAAVDRVLSCDPDAVGAPVVPLDGGALASEQELCLPYVQVDFYPDQGALERSLGIWRGSSQGEVHIVRGGNWMVVDLTEVATGEPASANYEALADELGAEYTVVGE